jgi:hypothetical protein
MGFNSAFKDLKEVRFVGLYYRPGWHLHGRFLLQAFQLRLLVPPVLFLFRIPLIKGVLHCR